MRKLIKFFDSNIKELITSVKNNSSSIFKMIIILLFTTLMVGLMMKIPALPFIGGTTDSWLQYWSGIIGAMLGVYGAFSVMQHQIKLESKNEEKSKKPIIVPNEILFDDIVFAQLRFNRDINNFDKYEAIYIPIHNVGGSTIYDIEYEMDLVNLPEIEHIAPKFKTTYSDGVAFKFLIEDSEFTKGIKEVTFDYNQKHGRSIMKIEEIRKTKQTYPMLNSKDSFNLYIDTYIYMIISSMIYTNMYYEVAPKIKIKLKYLDNNFEEQNFDFLIGLKVNRRGTRIYASQYKLNYFMKDVIFTFTLKPDYKSVKKQLEES